LIAQHAAEIVGKISIHCDVPLAARVGADRA
jgi:hypothetical protein